MLVNALSRHTFVLLHKPLNITDPNYLNICIEFEITTYQCRELNSDQKNVQKCHGKFRKKDVSINFMNFCKEFFGE